MNKEWQTKVKIKPSIEKIDYTSNLILLGSCFSSEIGKKLMELKFNVALNPGGISFNPISIFNQFKKLDLEDDRIVEKDGLFFHYDFHSSINHETTLGLAALLHRTQDILLSRIKSCNWLIITLGTAIVHETLDSKVTANCHKQGKNLFNKRYLTVKEITDSFQKFYSQINADTTILLNVSPIRHTKEGLENNQLSKSILRVACSEISAKHKQVHYLPTYEIFIDELRDYRFYKKDMIHPSEEAVDYVFALFLENFFTLETCHEVKTVSKLIEELKHKPINKHSVAYKKFKQRLLKKLGESRHNFSQEIEHLK